jgi:RNA polymerase sigma factor (sigma-70 family)
MIPEGLYASLWTPMTVAALRVTGDWPSAEDVVQDALIRADVSGIDAGKTRAYVRAMVVNAAVDVVRHRKVAARLPWLDPQVPSAESTALDHLDRRDVAAELRMLPLRQRQVLTLRYAGGLSEREIAAVLGIAPGTVKHHAHRGISTLRAKLA